MVTTQIRLSALQHRSRPRRYRLIKGGPPTNINLAHGLMNSYSQGCRCPACQGANAARAAHYRLGHPLVDRCHQLALSHVPMYGAWQADAACRGEPVDLFFPERPADTGLAREICAGCPVVVECRAYGLAHPGLLGLFGGLDEVERRRIRREERAAS